MTQVTLRIDDQLNRELKAAAAARGTSFNAWATAVLRAAVDPDLADDEAERLRARLRRSGLLEESSPPPGLNRPAADAVERARRSAGRGRLLSDLVSEDRN